MQNVIVEPDHTQRNIQIRYNSPGQGIGQSQRSLPAQHTTFRKKSMTLLGFESAIPAIKPPQNYALHRVATGIDRKVMSGLNTDGCESEKG